MIVFANKKVYVQKNDLMYLMRGTEGQEVPASIIDKVFGDVFIVTDDNRYEFMEFSEPEEIEFFKHCDWMVDYNQFDDMTEDQIFMYGYEIQEKRNEIAQAYNFLPAEKKEKQYMKISTQIELMDFKMMSVRDVLWYKQGKLNFNLPTVSFEDYTNKSNVEEQHLEDESIIEEESELSKENVFQKVLRKIKKNKKEN